MRKLLLGMMILGMLAGVGAAFFGLAERQKFYQEKIKAEEERDRAVKEKQKAQQDQQDALRKREEAEYHKEQAEKKRDEAIKQKEEAEKKAHEAEKKAHEAEQTKLEAEKQKQLADEERRQAEIERDKALVAKQKAEEERNEALATAELEKQAREDADKRMKIAVENMNKAAKELAEIKALAEIGKRIVDFSNSLNNILFPLIDVGDDYFMRGLKGFSGANKSAEQRLAIKQLGEAKKKYEQAQKQLQELTPIGGIDHTRAIKELSVKIAEENLECVKIVEQVLIEMMRGSETLSEENKQKKYLEVCQRKEKADQDLIDLCTIWQKLIEEHKESFPKAYRTQIDSLMKKITTERLGGATSE